MEIDPKAARRAVAVIAIFVLAGTAVIIFLFTGTTVQVPLLSEPRSYQVSLIIPDVDNLVTAGKVEVAGVEVGDVREIDPQPDGMRVTLALNTVAAPLHQGIHIRVGSRSLVEETYLDVTDGTGPEIPSGTTLPPGVLQPSVQVRDILHSLDPGTRSRLGQMLRSLGTGADGTKPDVDALMAGFGALGNEGRTALDAIAAQTDSLHQLVPETATLLQSLDTNDGEIADLVTNADQITKATGGQRPAVEASLRQLPGVLDSADKATVELTKLGHALGPVADDLDRASPDLSRAFDKLPDSSRDLRYLTRPLDEALDRAPTTLRRVPRFADDTQNLIPPTQRILQETNPILGYLRPYGKEIDGFISNFNAILGYKTPDGIHYARLLAVGNDQFGQSPFPVNVNTSTNPYPRAGMGNFPGPFTGKYPRVEREPK